MTVTEEKIALAAAPELAPLTDEELAQMEREHLDFLASLEDERDRAEYACWFR